jgi:hypothetical protein
MRHRALLLGVVLPAALSHAFYVAVLDRAGSDRVRRHERRFERAELVYDVRPPSPPHAPRPPRLPSARPGFCGVREVRVLGLPASPDGRIALSMGGGELDMDAVEGLDRVEVEATVCAPSAEALDRVGVTLLPDGDVIRLETGEPDRFGRVDLKVRVPAGMRATIVERGVGDVGERARGPRPRR